MIMFLMTYLYWGELYDDCFGMINYACALIFRNSIVHNLFDNCCFILKFEIHALGVPQFKQIIYHIYVKRFGSTNQDAVFW